MILAVELIIALLFGFVLGRIYEIRKQLVLAQQLRNRQHTIERRLCDRGTQRSQKPDRKPSIFSARPNKEVSAAPASALPFRSSPTAFAGRLRGSQQSHIGGSSPQHQDNDGIAQQPMDQG
jgi:hypothetical protein